MPANAAAAPNLISNPGFETAGGSSTMFSDTLPDFKPHGGRRVRAESSAPSPWMSPGTGV